MNREYKDYLGDIIDSIQKIEIFAEGMTYDDFIRDSKTIYAEIRALEIIGEAVKKLPAELKLKYSNIPWKEMADMRNKLIHEYFGVDVRVLWKTIHEDIPLIKPVFQKILNDIN